MGRTMMLEEITTLFRTLPLDAELCDYQKAVEIKNVLGKPTESSRKMTFKYLKSLYGLDPALPLFYVLRRLAQLSQEDLPLLAMLLCYIRDPQLRASFDLIATLRPGEELPRTKMEEHLEEAFPGRFGSGMKTALAQRVNGTWTMCGHLRGGTKKYRATPKAGWAASAFAMFSGHLSGLNGQILLDSIFSQLVATSPERLITHLQTASVHGFVRLRHAGGVTEIDFSELLSQAS